MSASARSGRIEQVVYRYVGGDRGVLNRYDVSPVASSLDERELAKWAYLLGPQLGADPGYPYPSLCYLISKDRWVLVWRVTEQPGNRRSAFTHVLTGDGELPVEWALGSWRWDWPGAITAKDPYARQLEPVNADAFTDAAEMGWRALESAGEPPGLSRLIIGVLGQPDLRRRKIAVLAEPGDLRVRLLAGLVRQLGPAFLADGFSTHEPYYDEFRRTLPGLVFATADPGYSTSAVARVVVDLRPAGDPARAAASAESDADVASAAGLLTRAYRADGRGVNLARLLAGESGAEVSGEEARWLRSRGFIPANPQHLPHPSPPRPAFPADAPSGSRPEPELPAPEPDWSAGSQPILAPDPPRGSPVPPPGRAPDLPSRRAAGWLGSLGSVLGGRQQDSRETQATPPLDPVSRAVQHAVQQGSLVFNPPAKMIQGRKERVEVGIARSTEFRDALAAGLRGRGELQFERVATSSSMGVELKGDAFEITPFSPLEQLVAPTARWEFDVKPCKAGQQSLILCVFLLIDLVKPARTGGGRIAVPVLEREIQIRVDLGYATRRFLANNWQWLIATAVGLGGGLAAWAEFFR